MSNPFDELDATLTPDERAALDKAPRLEKGLGDFFSTGRQQGFYQDTLLGHSVGNNEQQGAAGNAAYDDNALPQWEDMSLLQMGAYSSGRLLGNMMTPEAFAGGALGVGKKALSTVGVKSAGWGARFFAGTVDAAIVNAGIDTGLQVQDIAAGKQSGIDPTRLATSTALGGLVGGAFHSVLGGRDAGPESATEGNQAAMPGESRDSATSPSASPPDPSLAEALPASPEAQQMPLPDATPDPAKKPSVIPQAHQGVATQPPAALPAVGEILDGAARTVRGLPPHVADSMPTEAPVTATVPEASAAATVAPTPGKSAGTFLFDPASLKVDANRFQFKSGGDGHGVVDTLKNVKSWVPERGNALIVWQDKAGQNFVVDGHQRTGLARRLVEQGHESQIQLPGVLYRESDGISAEDAMVSAALKNISEGNTNPIDGAKVIRIAGKDALKNLPMNKDAVRSAADLATLDDSSFKMVVNEVVDPAYAKYVGRFLPDDPVRQKAAMDALARFDPANEDEAALFVRRVADAEIVKSENRSQTDMFGTDPQSTVLEEIKIVAAAIRGLRSDKSLFARVFKNADRIEKAGSTVARDESAAAAEFAARAAVSVEKEAFRAGPIRDRLKELAVEVKHGRQTVAQAREAFLGHLQRSEIRPDQARTDAGRGTGTGEPAAAAARPATEPGADGKAQTILTGTERIGQGELAQSLADRPLKADAPQNPGMGDGLLGDAHKQDEMFSLASGQPRGSLARDPLGTSSAGNETAGARVKDIAEELMASLNAVAVRFGRITKAKADGIYKVNSGVIRLRTPDDFDTLAHELGHHLEEHLGKDVKTLMKAHAGELEPMAYAGANPALKLEEGFAEYVRTMATNPVYAAAQAPQFDAALRTMLQQQHPEVLAAIDKAAVAWRQWLEQPSATAVASTIVSSRQPKWFSKLRKELAQWGLGNTIYERMSALYTEHIDQLNPIAKAVRALVLTFRDNKGKLLDLPAARDPYKMARLLPGAYQAGHIDIMHGVADFQGTTPRSSSLRDALVTAMGKPNVLSGWNDALMQKFGGYLWSRRALGEWERFDKGLIPNVPDKLTRGDHVKNIAEMEAQYPAFVKAAPMVHDFAQALWTKKFEGGLITREQYEAGLLIKDYVPGIRAFDQLGDTAGIGGKKSGNGKSGFMNRFKGSNRDVLHPLETLMQDAYQTSRAIAQNEMVRALDQLAAKAGPGGGAIAERIPSHQLKAMNLTIGDVAGQIADHMDLNEIDTKIFRDLLMEQVGDEKLTYFRPSVITEKGEAIAFFREGGELRALKLADGQLGRDMHEAMSFMSNKESNVFVNLLATSAQVLRTGVTAAPEFILANAIRDLATSVIFYGKPLRVVKGMIGGMRDELFSRDAARLYNAMGGIMGGDQVAGLGEARLNNDLQALRKKGWAANRLSFKGVLEITELSETGMRIGLFKDFFDEAKGRGLSDYEAGVEAAYQARDHVDYNRRGSQMAAISRMVPFLNANLQGVDKAWRHMIAPAFTQAATITEKRAKAEAAKAWARVSALTVATMGLHALMSENDEYNDISPQTKATHWMFKWGGNYVAVPKPFELGAVLNAGVAAYDAMVRHDPRWAEEYKQGLYEVLLPPNVLTGNPLVTSAFNVMGGNDVRSGRPIVPEQLQGLDPSQQYDKSTSDLFKALGKATGTSPMFMQYVFLQNTGSIGRSMTSAYDYALSDKPLQGWDDTMVTRRFIKDASRGASSTRAFWDLVGSRTGKVEGMRKSWQNMIDAGDERGASAFFGQQDEATKAWIAAGSAKPDIRRLHPYMRARSAVTAINDLQRDITSSSIDTANGPVVVSARDRGAADDILSKLAMTEARNALVMMKVPGWADRQVIDTAGYYRELQSLSPPLAKALADRMAKAKVLPLDVVEKLWPETKSRLLRDGSQLRQDDLIVQVKAAGYEMNGTAMKRKPRAKVAP